MTVWWAVLIAVLCRTKAWSCLPPASAAHPLPAAAQVWRPLAMPQCAAAEPALVEVAPSHSVACHLY